MGLTHDDIQRLGLDAKRQIEEARKKHAYEKQRRQLAAKPDAPKPKEFGSRGEYEFYMLEVTPGCKAEK